MRIRNVVFTILFCSFLLGPIALFSAQKVIKVELPPNVTAKNAEYLSGNVSEVDVRANLSLKAFISGNMQTALESEVGNNIPFLADALLYNAAVQRNAIACSNSVFNWKCYPTFYGSHYVVDPQHNALFEMPLLHERKISDRNTLEKGLVDFGKSLSIIAKEYPEKKFYVVIADRSSTSASNPASALVSETMFSNECAQVIATEISDNTNVSINVSTYDSVEKYLEDYYPTDHHWNGYGAIHAMPREVIEENAVVPSDEIDPLSFGKLIFDGTSSRRGLICLNKGVAEPNFNVEEITADKTTSPYFSRILSEDGVEKVERDGLAAEYNFYALWYGDVGHYTLTNKAIDSGAALLFSDSYGDPVKWIVSGKYHKVIGNIELKTKHAVYDFNNVIQESDCDDIYLVAWAGSFAALP